MNRIILTALLGAFSLASQAHAAVRGAVCDGCSDTQMAARASGTARQGTVYVFNTLGARVGKYEVFTEVMDITPYTTWTQAIAMPVETTLADAFTSFVASHDAVQGDSEIELPPDFPVRSVAGALTEPDSTTTHIEQFLRSLSLYRQLQIDVGALTTSILSRNIPLVDLSGLIKVVKVTIEFPDGSKQDYSIHYSLDVISGEAALETSVAGNALLPDGTPAPTGPLGFDGLRVNDFHGSIQEWLMWARLNSASISGPANGTRMTCSIKGGVIHCVVSTRG